MHRSWRNKVTHRLEKLIDLLPEDWEVYRSGRSTLYIQAGDEWLVAFDYEETENTPAGIEMLFSLAGGLTPESAVDLAKHVMHVPKEMDDSCESQI